MKYQGVSIYRAQSTPIVVDVTEDGTATYQGETLIRFVDEALGWGWHSADWRVQVYEDDQAGPRRLLPPGIGLPPGVRGGPRY